MRIENVRALDWQGERFENAGTRVPSINAAIDSGDGRNYYKWITTGKSNVKYLWLGGRVFLRKVKTDPPKPYVVKTDTDSTWISYSVVGNFHRRDGSSYTQSLGSTSVSFVKHTYHWSNGTTTEDDWSESASGPETIYFSVPSGWSGPSSYTFYGMPNTDPTGGDVTEYVDFYEN